VSLVAVPSPAYRMSVWVPSWDSRGLTSMQAHAGKLDETNPEWYTVTADGGVARLENSEAPDLRAAIAGTDVVPMIQNFVNGQFDANVVANIVASPDLRERHAETLTALVVQNAYRGIDIDYESLNAASRANFTAFVQLLSQKLHAANKMLSVTVHAKASDEEDWDGPGAQDWRAIGLAADVVKIMGYDEHYDGSVAGPIASIAFLDSVAAYAESTIPAQKIIIALPWYGYEWQGTRATDLVYAEAIALAQSVGAQITHDVNGEATFSYAGRIVYFQDASSYAKKTSAILSKHPNIAGFAHWRAGGEDPAIWTDVSRLHNTSSMPATGRRRSVRH
jgi:spore germination protein